MVVPWRGLPSGRFGHPAELACRSRPGSVGVLGSRGTVKAKRRARAQRRGMPSAQRRGNRGAGRGVGGDAAEAADTDGFDGPGLEEGVHGGAADAEPVGGFLDQ